MGGASVTDASGMRPDLVLEQITFPKMNLFGNVACRHYQNGAMTCQLAGARRLHMALEAMLIAVTRTWGKTPGNDLCIVSSRSRISLNLKS